MAHHTVRGAYDRLVDRLNRFPQGAPPSRLLHGILQLLFTEREADLVARLPVKPFTAADAARAWRLADAEAARLLDGLADKAVLLDIERDGETRYVLPPPMAGFFEFSLMRVREDVDQRLLAELFYQYLNVEDDFVKALFIGGETQMGRAFVNERALAPEHALHVLDHERASWMIRSASHIGVGLCYCRHKMQHLGRACDAPMEICLTLNTAAAALARHGAARAIDAAEALDLLDAARERGLVQFGENAQRQISFICNCCGCCCEAMIAARRFGHLHPVHTTNFLPVVDPAACNGCGRCVAACPVGSMSLISAHDPRRRKAKVAAVDVDTCLGCGVCVPACTRGGLRLETRKERVITPVTSTHRIVLMAIERGKLQDLIFDNRALASHRAMAAILGAILRLPRVKRALASRQLRSRYVTRLLSE